MAGKIPESRREDAQCCFDELKDDDGCLNLVSFITLCQQLGQDTDTAEVEVWFGELDRDGDGTLTWDECDDMIGKKWKSLKERREEMKTALFDLFGEDPGAESGTNISVADLKEILTTKGCNPMSEEEADALITEMNTDEDKDTVNHQEILDFIYDRCKEDEEEGGEDEA